MSGAFSAPSNKKPVAVQVPSSSNSSRELKPTEHNASSVSNRDNSSKLTVIAPAPRPVLPPLQPSQVHVQPSLPPTASMSTVANYALSPAPVSRSHLPQPTSLSKPSPASTTAQPYDQDSLLLNLQQASMNLIHSLTSQLADMIQARVRAQHQCCSVIKTAGHGNVHTTSPFSAS